MTIDGTIVLVMESWPLQLVVETEGGRQQVTLRSDTAITANGQPVEAGHLVPGTRVRIDGDASGTNALSASALEIIPVNR
jgi:hypothetical protein